jgi:hypothetical protein
VPLSATPGGYWSTLAFGDQVVVGVVVVVVGVVVVVVGVVVVVVGVPFVVVVVLLGVCPPLQPAVTRRSATPTARAARRVGGLIGWGTKRSCKSNRFLDPQYPLAVCR